jgi:hypothetical protein
MEGILLDTMFELPLIDKGEYYAAEHSKIEEKRSESQNPPRSCAR